MKATTHGRRHDETLGTLPRAAEAEQRFGDVLYDWLGRAPYLAVAIALHLLAVFLLHLVEWRTSEAPVERVIATDIEAPPLDEFVEPPPPPAVPVEVDEVVEPVIVDAVVEDTQEVEHPSDDLAAEPSLATQPEIGLGGGAAGPAGPRATGRARTAAPVARALSEALDWLADHQNPAGYWDCDGFMGECDRVGEPLADGAGEPLYDVGVTGLALLAFLGYGDTMNGGRYQDIINRGVRWLRDQQQESGLIGDDVSHDFMYGHAIATLALCEAYTTAGRTPLLRPAAQKAVGFVQRARNPYAAWRYAAQPDGDDDTSVTGWMVFALAAAQHGGLAVDPEALRGALSWFDEVTDPATGRVGYDRAGGRGGSSARTRANEHYPRAAAETMTAVAMLGRVFALDALGTRDEPTERWIERGAELLRAKPPTWSADGSTNDMYYWYYGSYAMYQVGGNAWGDWQRAMERAILPHQRHDGCAAGSWDPNGPWGYAGGRVYATALMALSLEVYFRYSRLTGTR